MLQFKKQLEEEAPKTLHPLGILSLPGIKKYMNAKMKLVFKNGT